MALRAVLLSSQARHQLVGDVIQPGLVALYKFSSELPHLFRRR